jgi:hypothetical protein
MRRTHQQPTEENSMRKFIISATVAAVAAISFAAPAYAGHHGHHRHHGHYHGGFSIGFYDGGYYGGHYEPSCYVKKVKRWDRWGNLRIKRVTICN